MTKIQIGTKAAGDFRPGPSCAETVLAGLSRDLGIPAENLAAIAAALWTEGDSENGTCGALNGALMALGLKFGRSRSAGNGTDAYEMTRRMTLSFEAEFGSTQCIRLQDLPPELAAAWTALGPGNPEAGHCRHVARRASELAAALLQARAAGKEE